jgi:hypothetical protein
VLTIYRKATSNVGMRAVRPLLLCTMFLHVAAPTGRLYLQQNIKYMCVAVHVMQIDRVISLFPLITWKERAGGQQQMDPCAIFLREARPHNHKARP